MRFAFIDGYGGELSRKHLCRLFRVSDRGFRDWRGRSPSQRSREDLVLAAHIRAQSRLCNFSYGRIRMTMELRDLGFFVGERRVARLMAANDIKVIRTHKYKRTTDSRHGFPFAHNLLKQDFESALPNQKWVSDISYVWTKEGWLYLAVVIDLFSRKVVGWETSDRLKRDLAVRALRMAIMRRRPNADCIHHSDRGSQYASYDYQKLLKKHGLQPSMSGKGNCYDNAACETFFKTIKSELLWRSSWQTRDQAHGAIAKYIDEFYNPRRKHSTLGYLAPNQFEAKMNTRKTQNYAA